MSTNFTNKNISSIKINDVKYNIKSAFFHAKESEWKTEELNSYIPKQGEIVIYDIDDVYAYERFKIGDGVQNVIDLPFYNDGFVSYYETQTLTDEQKAQARENIGVVNSDWNQIDESATDYIKNKPDIATDDEIISMLTEEDMLPVVADSDGAILADESDNILLW